MDLLLVEGGFAKAIDLQCKSLKEALDLYQRLTPAKLRNQSFPLLHLLSRSGQALAAIAQTSPITEETCARARQLVSSTIEIMEKFEPNRLPLDRMTLPLVNFMTWSGIQDPSKPSVPHDSPQIARKKEENQTAKFPELDHLDVIHRTYNPDGEQPPTGDVDSSHDDLQRATASDERLP